MFDKKNIIQTALQIGCTESQAEEFWKLLNQGSGSRKNFNLVSIFYYLGGLIVLCALVWFLGESITAYGKTCLFLVSLTYVITFYVAGIYLWKMRKNKTLGGIACFLSLSLVPLTTYAFQSMLGWWPGSDPGAYIHFYNMIKGGWFFMEIVTLTCVLISLRFIQFPLLAIILYLTLWFMSLDILPFFVHVLSKNSPVDMINSGISIFLGCAVMAKAYFLERKDKKKDAFWAFLFGVSIFWIGITLEGYQTEWGYALYCFLNVVLLFLGSLFNKKAFAIFGVLGILNYLGQLVMRHFFSSPVFPIVLSFVGLVVIVMGIFLRRYKVPAAT